ncbi:2OG-Fe(II) oxygenase [Azospirillum isscasi]|uniref:2OG-Fe(II) oxygenase n=1 Tax=Azospirillum isscasi TaxID=3053926 RepID=A0ABU0WCX3_9PROT|nr:2OG-Fe(II) oxygenase [Azospirillum isscasi]MDQ2101996.1 2OG-Fe(II) oxygenase [Azospirillum isscasi]
MVSPDTVQNAFIRCLDDALIKDEPYRHWLLSRALPEEAAEGIAGLPWAPPPVGDTQGKRDTNNATRSYFSVRSRAEHAVCDAVAGAFQGRAVTQAIRRACGVDLSGSSLRIEYCQDTDGFWLEPHTDIGVKKFTMLIYLSKGPDCADWGTDVLNASRTVVARAPFAFNGGLVFIPGTDTWHGFAPRPIRGVRKSIIVNYVGPEWRARHELAFPDTPVA